MNTPDVSGTAPLPLWQGIWRWTAPIRRATLVGAFSGAISAGVGSRVVMRIIALSDPDTDGAFTDAEATVGEVTVGGTLELVFLGTVAGVMGGLVYLGVRRWLPVPPAWKGLAYGVVTLLTVGQLLFDQANADFQIFEPVLLVLALFSVLFLVNGLIISGLLDRWQREPEYRASSRVSLAVTSVLAVVCALGLFAHVATTVEMVDEQGTCLSAAGGGRGCAVQASEAAP